MVNGFSVSEVSSYNVTSNIWKNGLYMLEARFGCASCVSWENVIYLLGGISANDNVIRSMVMLQCDVHGEAVTGSQSLHHKTHPR